MKQTTRTMFSTLAVLVAVPLTLHAQQSSQSGLPDSGSVAIQVLKLKDDGTTVEQSMTLEKSMTLDVSQFLDSGTLDIGKLMTVVMGQLKDSIPEFGQLLEEIGKGTQGESLEKPPQDNGSHSIIVLDSVRAGEKELADFSRSLQAGEIRIRKNGVRTIRDNAPEATKYGAGPQDTVIIISTEVVGEQQRVTHY